MSAFLRYAVARFGVRRGRALLAIVGIAAAGAMVGAAVTLAWSLGTGFDRTAARAGLPDVIATFSPASERAIAARVSALPDLRGFAFRLETSGVHAAAGGRFDGHANVVGVGAGRRGYAVVAGHDVRSNDDAVVEQGLARAWGLHLGGTIGLSDWRGASERLRIVGVAVSPETVAFPLAHGPRIYTSRDEAAELAGTGRGQVSAVLLWLRDPRLLDVVLAQARAASYGLQGLQFATRAGLRVEIGQAAGIVLALLVGFCAVALVVAGTMLAASAGAEVQRRLAAFGLLQALGARRRSLVLGSLLEAVAVAAPAGAFGIAAGWLAVAGPANRLLASIGQLGPGWSIAPLLTLALVGLVALVALGSVWPALRAVRRPVVETLRGADVTGATARLPLPAGLVALGLRLLLARPLRTALTVLVLAAATAVVLVIVAIASVLQALDRQPAAVGKLYQLSVDAPASALLRLERLPGVAAASVRWQVQAADSFRLGEPFALIAFSSDHGRFEAPPLAAGARLRGDGEAEVGLGLAQALDLHPGATLAAQLPDGREARWRVAGVVRAFTDQGLVAYVRPRRLLAADPYAPETIAIRLRPGASASMVTAAVARRTHYATGASGGVAGEAVQGWAARSSGFIAIIVALLRTVAILNGAVCLYAVAQVLVLTAQERRRALALLRGLGAGRLQLTLLFAGAAGAVTLLALPLAVVLERWLVAPVVSALAASYVSLSLAAGAGAVGATAAGILAGAALVSAWVGRAAGAGPVVAALQEE